MRRTVALVVSLALFLQGCVQMQAVQLPRGGSATPAVQVGDRVEVTTQDGKVHRFQVTEVTSDALSGKDIRVAYADMADLKVAQQKAAQSRTALWVIAGVIIAGALIAAGGGSGGSSY